MRVAPAWIVLSVLLFASVATPARAQILERLRSAVEDVLEGADERPASATCTPASSDSDVIFRDDFESGSLGSAWVARPGEEGVVRVVDRLPDVPPIPYAGDYALAIGRKEDGNYSTEPTLNAADLCLDLSGRDYVMLYFQIRSQRRKDDPDDSDGIFLSNDGGQTFVQALRFRPRDWAEEVYGGIAFDVAAAAEQLDLSLNEDFVVRIQQIGANDFAGRHDSRDGFFIDDVIAMGAPTYVRPPFRDGFESGTLGSAWSVADPFRKGETAPELQAQWGFVEPVERLPDVLPIPHTGAYALAMGRPSGGGVPQVRSFEPTVNAADLHLDLSGKDEVVLRFYLRDEADEARPDRGRESAYDGLFLSDDGGAHFVRALEIDGRDYTDGEYNELTLNLVEVANQLGLSLTDRFIVRFQQGGSQDFADVRVDQRDGFFIDDVVVEASLTPQEEVAARVAAALNAWKERGKFEKAEDYEARIAGDLSAIEDSLTQQVVNEIGAERIDWATARNTYNPDRETFEIHVEHLEPFDLAVPISQAEAFDARFSEVEFANVAYALGDGDALKVLHVEATEPASGRTYVYDAR